MAHFFTLMLAVHRFHYTHIDKHSICICVCNIHTMRVYMCVWWQRYWHCGCWWQVATCRSISGRCRSVPEG